MLTTHTTASQGSLEREFEALKRAQRVHDELIEVMLVGQGIASLVDRLALLLGNPIAVADHLYHVIATAPRGEHGDPHRRRTISRGATARAVLDNPIVGVFFRRVAEERRPVVFPAFPQYGMDHRRLMAPILAGRDLLGIVTVLEEHAPLQDFHGPILQQAAVILALDLIKQRAVLEAEMALRADFLRDLFSGNYVSVESIAMRANLLNVDLFRPWDLLLVEADDIVQPDATPASAGATRFSAARGQLLDIVRRSVPAHTPGSIVIAHSEGILVLQPAESERGDGCALADLLREQVRQAFRPAGVTVSVGVGGRCAQPGDFGARYAQARRVLEVSRSLGRRDQTLTPGALGVYGVLFQTGGEDNLAHFAQRTLGPLCDYDSRRSTALVATLEAFFEEHGSLRKTATRLQIHLNTLRGRLERISDVLQTDLADPRVRLSLQLALEINRVAGPSVRSPRPGER